MAGSGPPSEPPMKAFSPDRDDQPVARSARRILRMPVEASEERANPADAFSSEAPCPRATTEASRKYQSATGGSRQSRDLPTWNYWKRRFRCEMGWEGGNHRLGTISIRRAAFFSTEPRRASSSSTSPMSFSFSKSSFIFSAFTSAVMISSLSRDTRSILKAPI